MKHIDLSVLDGYGGQSTLSNFTTLGAAGIGGPCFHINGVTCANCYNNPSHMGTYIVPNTTNTVFINNNKSTITIETIDNGLILRYNNQAVFVDPKTQDLGKELLKLLGINETV